MITSSRLAFFVVSVAILCFLGVCPAWAAEVVINELHVEAGAALNGALLAAGLVDEWVAYEYSKVRRLYDHLGIGDRTAIEFFNGPHTINGVGTFEFLHKHLAWPAPGQ